jgi:hypothetical protein
MGSAAAALGARLRGYRQSRTRVKESSFSSVRTDRGMGATAGCSGSWPEANGRFDCWTTEHHGSAPQIPGLPYILLHLVLAPVDYGRCPGMWLSGQFDPGTDLCLAQHRLWPSASHGLVRRRGARLEDWIEVGRQINEHIHAAPNLGSYARMIPFAQHEPQSTHEHRFLLGASLPRVPAHRRNIVRATQRLLGSSRLVVPTVDNLGVEFFKPTTS